MKKNEFDFSIPNRQSYVAILLILFKTVTVVVRQIIPLLFVILIGGSSKKGDYILWSVVGIALLSMIYSVVNFFRTYFYIQDAELIFHTGVFQRKKTTIPLARIQTVNFEQNIIHQLFNVLKLKIDTAGSDKDEFQIHAIESEKAYALRNIILLERDTKLVATTDATMHTPTKSDPPHFIKIMSLSPVELLKVGITENHIKSGGVIILFFFWIYQNLQEVGVDVDEYSNDLPDWEFGLTGILFLSTLFMMISVVISLVRAVVTHFDLQFLRSQHGFKVVSGLFTKKEVSALDHKIQHISWSDNLLKRWIGFRDLSLNQASSTTLKTKQNITIPGCNSSHITHVVTSLFGETDFDSFEMQGINYRYFSRFALILGILTLPIVVITTYYFNPINAIFLFIGGGYFILTRYISYRKKAFGYNDSLIYIKGGIFGDKAEILPMYKIQGINIHETPYQTRNKLCSITLYTASGSINIPYISYSVGSKLADLLLFKVERDKRKWM